jgi:hypothetical protein
MPYGRLRAITCHEPTVAQHQRRAASDRRAQEKEGYLEKENAGTSLPAVSPFIALP